MGSVSPAHPADHNSLPAAQSATVRHIYDFVEQFFQNPQFDASHDFRHVRRVTRTAIEIFEAERTANPDLDLYTIILGALLHDVEDKKYAQSKDAIKLALLEVGMPEAEASRLQRLVEGVSYSSEIKDSEKVRLLIAEIPELAVVQDADRLDAIGAIGIARCFTFGGAKDTRSLEESVEHFHDKLFKLEGMMKTETGKVWAAERTRVLHDFVDCWNREIR
ncbi:uncharacterized protein AB675_5263 [Cyphellophora attinorum]|uniref:HD/PDEase domain-containing protein n=1 Tax=Cyphellophora attinorum TaxID=1664694 RepID=A0A0N0NLV8_9EURO|nr:uncharacterized protein AB675_5263 [Phialophora attinorum]KPI39489.1 hypothetical protein AB675_5263 [Phialophora attinorum]